MSGFPNALAGHWDTSDGREMAERYLEQDRSQLGKGDLSDMALANAQYLEDISVGTVTFQSAIAMQTAAKERIRWLSAQLANTLAALGSIAEATSAEDDAGENYRWDDREGALDYAYATAKAAILKATGQSVVQSDNGGGV